MHIVSDLDRMIGLEVYSTATEGVKGRIRRSSNNSRSDGHYDHFMVEEVIDVDGRISISKVRDNRHRYPLFILRKEGIDTIHALKELESKYGLRLNALGLKDANASTLQYVTSDRVLGVRRRKRENIGSEKGDGDGEGGGEGGRGMGIKEVDEDEEEEKELSTRHCSLKFVGYLDRMLRKRDLIGNRFTITIEIDPSDHEYLEKIKSVIMEVRARRVGNFYGYQRFGSIRPVTHLVGKAITKRRFREAVDTFLTYIGEYEDEQSRNVRLMLRDGLSEESIEHIPYHMDLERDLVESMIKSSDPIRALRRLPISVRRLFVEAYQAYIFNRTLSIAIREGYDISTPSMGDICFSVDVNNKVGDICRFDGSRSKDGLVPAIPLVGFAFKPIGRFGTIVERVMEEEEICSKDFYIKEMQEVSVEGGFRPSPLLLLYNTFEILSNNGGIRVRFALPKGSYATVLLREVIKPAQPTLVGF
ncbi:MULTISPECIES: tRNA pseudouridine(13) synthase TruD [Candidatus Nitrosocaldus]|jgi:tRNA pseudouridine13 synthase|uniref:TRUD domain-containing protein n=1 Tax=Candidatus Nitrosocaldus cavascurensis TaxID=2058097 RepID=A0A2K5AS26_9ARCH|nr:MULTISPECIES: tRNA pseudouridine(13) synthase TruD [Candidatus Nitrosocaldus]SPC34458.1 conserved protein of unknown function [Candidatus Nitrosocaldus cavascurensis]